MKKFGGIIAIVCGVGMLAISGVLMLQGETLKSVLQIIGFGFMIVVIGIAVLSKK